VNGIDHHSLNRATILIQSPSSFTNMSDVLFLKTRFPVRHLSGIQSRSSFASTTDVALGKYFDGKDKEKTDPAAKSGHLVSTSQIMIQGAFTKTVPGTDAGPALQRKACLSIRITSPRGVGHVTRRSRPTRPLIELRPMVPNPERKTLYGIQAPYKADE
jgi:hypothetical protein